MDGVFGGWWMVCLVDGGGGWWLWCFSPRTTEGFGRMANEQRSVLTEKCHK